jgi:hypothetical protein
MSFRGDSKLMVQAITHSGEVVAISTTITPFWDIILTTNKPINGRVFIFGGGTGTDNTV